MSAIREKGIQDYAELEAYVGAPFFADAGRTAIAQNIVGQEPLDLAAQNPVRHWMFKVATKNLASGVSETDPLISKLGNRLAIINNLEQYIADYESGLSGSRLREHQNDVFHDLADFMRGDPKYQGNGELSKAGFIEMPTGSGKTVVFTELVKAFHSDETKPIKSLILVPRKEILKQTIGLGKGKKRGFAEFAPDLNVTSYYGETKDLSGEVVVMTYHSFNNAIASGIIDKDFCDVVICDEAHRALGPVTSKNVKEFSEDKVAIGVTATSEYGENKKVEQLFPERIHVSRLREAINQGILAPVQSWVYKTNVKVDKKLSHPDYTSEELSFLAQIEGRNRKGVEFAKGFVQKGMQGIISCLPGENVRHPKIIADMLRATTIIDRKTGQPRHIRAQELSGEMTIAERNAYYEAFEAGEYDVLSFVDTISEGWDSERAKFLINLRPTCSPVFGVQRLGRILRPDEKGTVAQVVDFVDLSQKAQFVALHGLGEYRYVLGKVYGGNPDVQGLNERTIDLPEELKQDIKNVNSIQVKKLILGREHMAEYSDDVDMQTVGERMGMSPLALIFIARDKGMDLRVEGENALDIVNVKIKDMSEEALYNFARRKEYRYLHRADERILKAFVARQSEILADKMVAQKIEHRQQTPRPEFKNLGHERLIELIDEKRVAYDELTDEAKDSILNADLGTTETTRILFDITGKANEGLREAVYRRMVVEGHNPIYVLDYAKRVGMIGNISKGIGPGANGKICRLSFTTRDGRSIDVQVSESSAKAARFRANFEALGQAINLSEITAELKANTPTEDTGEQNARQILHNYLQSNSLAAPEYSTSHVLGHGKHTVFASRLTVTLSDGSVLSTEGNGTNKREAEENAALKVIGAQEILDWREKQQKPDSKSSQ